MGNRINNPMAVVPFTISISLMLVATFLASSSSNAGGPGQSSAEHDSLLPLAEEQPQGGMPTRPKWPEA